MAKKVESSFKLQIPAGQANPSPPEGTELCQRVERFTELHDVYT